MLWGEADPWEPVAEARRWAATYPCVRELRELPELGHCPHDEARRTERSGPPAPAAPVLVLGMDSTRRGTKRRMNAFKAGDAKQGLVAELQWLQR